MKKASLVLLITFFIANWASTSYSEPVAPKAKCPISGAIYKPSYELKKTSGKYRLKIRRKPVEEGHVEPEVRISVNIHNPDKTLQATINMGYACSGGSVHSCTIGFGNGKEGDDYKGVRFYPVLADKNLQEIYSLNLEAPYLLIIPRTTVQFKYIDWKDFPNVVEFQSSLDNDPPNYIPGIWVREKCGNADYERAKK